MNSNGQTNTYMATPTRLWIKKKKIFLLDHLKNIVFNVLYDIKLVSPRYYRQLCIFPLVQHKNTNNIV